MMPCSRLRKIQPTPQTLTFLRTYTVVGTGKDSMHVEHEQKKTRQRSIRCISDIMVFVMYSKIYLRITHLVLHALFEIDKHRDMVQKVCRAVQFCNNYAQLSHGKIFSLIAGKIRNLAMYNLSDLDLVYE